MNKELIVRLCIEYDELDLKMTKLHKFINDKELYDCVSKEQQYLLKIQFHTMKTYREILKARIENLKED